MENYILHSASSLSVHVENHVYPDHEILLQLFLVLFKTI